MDTRCPDFLFNETTDFLKNEYESNDLFSKLLTQEEENIEIIQSDKSKSIRKRKTQTDRKSLEPVTFQCQHCGKICKNRYLLYTYSIAILPGSY